MARPDPAPRAPHRAVTSFLANCHRAIVEATADRPATDPARRGGDALAAALAGATARSHEPARLPVLASLDRLDPLDPAHAGTGPRPSLAESFVSLAPSLPWVPTHRADDGGTELALAPLDRALDLGPTTVGLMLVGPGATYPLHRHPPQELYLTIAGTGRWRYGGNERDEAVGPLRTLYNHPGDLHTARAGDHPLVALYILW